MIKLFHRDAGASGRSSDRRDDAAMTERHLDSLEIRDIAPSSFLTGPRPSGVETRRGKGGSGSRWRSRVRSETTRRCEGVYRRSGSRRGTGALAEGVRRVTAPARRSTDERPLRGRRLVMVRRSVFRLSLATLALLGARPVLAGPITFTGFVAERLQPRRNPNVHDHPGQHRPAEHRPGAVHGRPTAGSPAGPSRTSGPSYDATTDTLSVGVNTFENARARRPSSVTPTATETRAPPARRWPRREGSTTPTWAATSR